MASIPNLGTAGAILNADTASLDYVTGPAVWFPGTAGNELTCQGFTIPSDAGLLTLPYVDGDLTITVADIATLPVESPQFTASTGQTVGIQRSATGTVTTIVPAGMAVYINNDPDTALNCITIPPNPILDIDPTDDYVIVWCGQLGNTVGVNGHLYRGGSANTSAARIQSSTNTNVAAYFQDSTPATFTLNLGASTPDHQPVCVMFVLDRGAETMRASIYNKEGLVRETVQSTPTAAGAVNVGGAQVLRSIPGSVSAFAFNTGLSVAPSVAEQAAIAGYLLQNYPRDPQLTYLTDPATGAYLTHPTTGLYLTRN